MANREVVKTVKNGVLYSDGTIRMDNVRLSYPNLDKPRAGKNDKGEATRETYSVVSMLDKTKHAALIKLIQGEIAGLIEREEAGKIAKDKICLRDGDDSDKAEYEGHFTISARESRRVSVRKPNGTPMSEKEIKDTIAGGDYGNVLVRLWYQDGKKVGAGYGKRINCGLVAVQFVSQGERFGEGMIDDEGVFDSVDGDNGIDEEDEEEV